MVGLQHNERNADVDGAYVSPSSNGLFRGIDSVSRGDVLHSKFLRRDLKREFVENNDSGCYYLKTRQILIQRKSELLNENENLKEDTENLDAKGAQNGM